MLAVIADVGKPLGDWRDGKGQFGILVGNPEAVALQAIDELIRAEDRFYKALSLWVGVDQFLFFMR